MVAISTLITFVLASIALILAPGPAQALVLARTIGNGRRAGILTAIGLNSGTIVHALAAAERLTGAVLIGLGVRLALLRRE